MILSERGRGWGGGGHLFEDGHFFEVDTNSWLGTYSNKFGSLGNATDLHYFRIPINPNAPGISSSVRITWTTSLTFSC